jgi:hypothetical protein
VYGQHDLELLFFKTESAARRKAARRSRPPRLLPLVLLCHLRDAISDARPEENVLRVKRPQFNQTITGLKMIPHKGQ